MSTPSDPQRGGQQPDDGSGTRDTGQGQPQAGGEGGQHGQQGAGQPGPYGGQQGPGDEQGPPYNPYAQPGQYGWQPRYPQPQPGQQQYGQPQYGQQAGQYAQPGQYGQPGQYHPYGQQGQYGQQPPYGGSPYGGQYDPYGGGPAGLGKDDAARVTRPGIMILSLVLLILSSVPFIAFGALLLVVPLDLSVIPPELGLDQQLEQAGLTPEMFISGLRAMAAVMLVVALLYVVFAVLAFLGRNWARIALTIMTVGFTLLMLATAFAGAAGDPTGMGFLLLIVALSVGGTIILFLPEPSRYFSRPRS